MAQPGRSAAPAEVLNPAYRRMRFTLGAAAATQFPPDDGWEVAIAGRSNAGKSSALNAIAGNRSLARVSKTPGRTREINFFQIDPIRRFVDLPGYGHAQVSHEMKRQWQALMEHYLQYRHALRGIIVVMDCRHPLTEFDWRLLECCAARGLPAHTLLTKADKLSKGAAMDTLHAARRTLAQHRYVPEAYTVQIFSALKKQGVGEVHAVLDKWLDL